VQAQGYCGRPVKYTDMVDVLVKTVANEGFRGLYKARRGLCMYRDRVQGPNPNPVDACHMGCLPDWVGLPGGPAVASSRRRRGRARAAQGPLSFACGHADLRTHAESWARWGVGCRAAR